MNSKRASLCLMAVPLTLLWLSFIGLAYSQPAASTPAVRTVSGHGVLQGGSRNNALSDAQLKNAKLNFVVLRDRWNRQETADGKFDFSYNVKQIRRCRKLGKGYVVALMTGAGSTPDFVQGPRYKTSKGDLCLAPWSPSIPAYYGRCIERIANETIDGVKIKDDPLCLAAWCTGPTVPSQEMHLNGLEKAPGFNQAGIVANWKECIRLTHKAFPNKPGILSLSGQLAVLKYQSQVVAAMEAEYGKDAVFQHNSLGKQTTVTAAHHQAVLAQERKGYRVGAEMVQPGNLAGLAKFPQRDYDVVYPDDVSNLK